MRRLFFLGFALLVAGIVAGLRPAAAATPAEMCRGLGTDDQLRPIPLSLVPTAVKLFGLAAMPAEQVQRGTVFRCDRGQVLICNYGANLPCGKADTRRDLPAAAAWCAQNPGADFIPMYVTGHDTIFRWRCDGAAAVTKGQVFTVDARGFIAQLWKPADP